MLERKPIIPTLFTGPQSNRTPIVDPFFSGIHSDFPDSLYKHLRDHLRPGNHTLTEIWKLRCRFFNGSITLEPSSADSENILQTYCNAAFQAFPDQKDLSVILGSWVYHYHERYGKLIRPMFNKSIITTDPKIVERIYWEFRDSGCPVDTLDSGQIFQPFQNITEFVSGWKNKLVCYDATNLPSHFIGSIREQLHAHQNHIPVYRSPIILLCDSYQLDKDENKFKGAVPV